MTTSQGHQEHVLRRRLDFFLAALSGPGVVWLQTLPLPNLAHALDPYLPDRGSDNSSKGTAGLLNNLLND